MSKKPKTKKIVTKPTKSKMPTKFISYFDKFRKIFDSKMNYIGIISFISDWLDRVDIISLISSGCISEISIGNFITLLMNFNLIKNIFIKFTKNK